MIAANPVFALEQFRKLIFKIYKLTFARTCSLQNTPIAHIAKLEDQIKSLQLKNKNLLKNVDELLQS